MSYASHIPSRTTISGGEEYLFFSGTAYLGIHARPEFGQLVSEGIKLWGTNYGASRLGNVSIPVFDRAESKLATWLGTPSALMVSSGTLAGRLVLEVLADEYEAHYSPIAHVAINPLYKKHEPQLFDSWIEQTLQKIRQSKKDKHLITFNSIDSLTAIHLPLDWTDAIPETKEVLLIADDSHGIGVMGEDGRGNFPALIRRHPHAIMIASMGKAMGLPAGLIAGSKEIVQKAKAHPLFGGSSPMVPAYAHAFLHSDEIYSAARRRLFEKMNLFQETLGDSGLFTFSQNFPVYCTRAHGLAAFLEERKIRISHFAYPSPADDLYTRVVLNALHTREDMLGLIEGIKEFIAFG